MPLDLAVRQSLLAEPHVSILAIEREGHAPIAVPIWHAYEPGGDAWVLVTRDSEKARLMRAAGRATLVVDTIEPRVRYASAACRVVDERPATEQDTRAIATRYLGEEGGEAYVQQTAARLQDEVVVTLRPFAWRSADLTI